MTPLVFVTVGMYWTPIGAWILRNRLADEGIDVFLADEFTVSMNWLYANAIGGIKVQVPLDQLSKAQAVLARDKSNLLSLTPRSATDEDELICQTCGSANVYKERYAQRAVFLSWLLLGIPLPIASSALECYDCGARHGPPTSYRFQYKLSHLLILMFVVACVLGIMRMMGHAWLEHAAFSIEHIWGR